MSNFNINQHELVYSLSDALDLVGVTDSSWQTRCIRVAMVGDNLDSCWRKATLQDQKEASAAKVH